MDSEFEKRQSLYSPEIYSGRYWPKITYYYAKTWTEFLMPFHHHASVELMYIFMGECSVSVLKRSGDIQEIPLQAGDFILLDAHVVHKLYVQPESFCYMLNVELLFQESNDRMFTMQNIVETCDAFSRVVDQHKRVLVGNDFNGELYRAIYILQHTYLRTRENPDNRCVFDAEMAVFLVQLGQILAKRRDVTGLSVHVKKAIRYIENRFNEPITVPEIAHHLGIHTAHLQRIFHAAVGTTVVQYLTNIRIEKAKMLMESKDHLTIEEIGYMVGFKSRQHFTLCFKKLTMITPNEYKNTQHRACTDQYVSDTSAIPHYELESL